MRRLRMWRRYSIALLVTKKLFQGIKMAVKVCKFGGTSRADADIIKSVKNRIESDGDRRFVVVSAPGKRYSGDKKITDMLFGCHKELINSGNCTKSFSAVRARFKDIADRL